MAASPAPVPMVSMEMAGSLALDVPVELDALVGVVQKTCKCGYGQMNERVSVGMVR